MESLSVKDFVINIPEIIKEGNKKQQKQTTSNSTFSIILENNTDFVLNRKTVTTDKDLVFLISQGVFYIKNNKNDKIETLSEQKLRSFFQQIYYEKFTEFKKVAWWDNASPEYKIEHMMNIIENENMQELYKHNMFFGKYDCNRWIDSFKKNKKLFQYCYDNLYQKGKGDFNYLLDFVIALSEKFNFNNAKFFIDKLLEGNIRYSLYYNGYGEDCINLIEKYNLNFTRFIEYIINDLYSQGIDDFSSNIFSEYNDYLNMQISLYGKVKEKYPKHLKTDHDIITLKFNTYQKFKQDLLIFHVADKYKDLEYKTKEYSIILPTTSIDIVDEGINQSHCVASYVDQVAKNETLIVFMRNTEEIDKSLITIEVQDNIVKQVRGFANRLPSIDEEKFLKKWAKDKKLHYEPSKRILN